MLGLFQRRPANAAQGSSPGSLLHELRLHSWLQLGESSSFPPGRDASSPLEPPHGRSRTLGSAPGISCFGFSLLCSSVWEQGALLGS